jgi:chorismate synthase
MGSPIALRIGNTEWPKWVEVMNPEPVENYNASTGRGAPLARPRPGHADLAGMQKFGFDDARNVLERASARETAMRVALGSVARGFLADLGIHALAHTVAIGEVSVPIGTPTPTMGDVDSLDADPLRCFDSTTSEQMVARVDRAHDDGDTLGGVVEVVVFGLPPGVGSYTHWDKRLDSRLAGALMGIQAIKGVEVGDGFESTRRPGSLAHDEMIHGDGIERLTDRAGGIEGGMTTGQPVRVRAGMKPISTVPRALRTVDTATGEAATAHHQRSDVCAVPAAGVVAEAMVILVIAEAILEKFGGDSIAETRRNMESFVSSIPQGLTTRRDV